jgi:hypothetical protein
MARAAGNTMKVDVALPIEMFETISRIARESNAPIHHRSGEPVVSPTIIRLIGLGILSATDNPEMMTADISRTGTDPMVSALSDRVRMLEDKLSDEGKDRLQDGVQMAIEQALAPIQDDLAELLLRVDTLESGIATKPSPKPAPVGQMPGKTSKAIDPSSIGAEVRSVVNRLRANAHLRAEVERLVDVDGLSNKEFVDRLFEAGFGQKNNTEPYRPGEVSRYRSAIECLNGEGDQHNG